jgi:hypothetical protein
MLRGRRANRCGGRCRSQCENNFILIAFALPNPLQLLSDQDVADLAAYYAAIEVTVKGAEVRASSSGQPGSRLQNGVRK